MNAFAGYFGQTLQELRREHGLAPDPRFAQLKAMRSRAPFQRPQCFRGRSDSRKWSSCSPISSGPSHSV